MKKKSHGPILILAILINSTNLYSDILPNNAPVIHYLKFTPDKKEENETHFISIELCSKAIELDCTQLGPKEKYPLNIVQEIFKKHSKKANDLRRSSGQFYAAGYIIGASVGLLTTIRVLKWVRDDNNERPKTSSNKAFSKLNCKEKIAGVAFLAALSTGLVGGPLVLGMLGASLSGYAGSIFLGPVIRKQGFENWDQVNSAMLIDQWGVMRDIGINTDINILELAKLLDQILQDEF